MPMTAEEFAESVHDVIGGAVNIYVEVNHILRELGQELLPALAGVVLAEPIRGDQNRKILKGWRGLLAAPALLADKNESESLADLVDEDDDGEEDSNRTKKRRGRRLQLATGGNLLFVKIVVHQFPHRVEPHLLAGVLSNAMAASGPAAGTLLFSGGYGRRLLDGMNERVWADGGVTFPSKTGKRLSGSKRKSGMRLRFKLDQRPIRRSLHEIGDGAVVRDIATALKEQWKHAADR